MKDKDIDYKRQISITTNDLKTERQNLWNITKIDINNIEYISDDKNNELLHKIIENLQHIERLFYEIKTLENLEMDLYHKNEKIIDPYDILKLNINNDDGDELLELNGEQFWSNYISEFFERRKKKDERKRKLH